MILFHKQSFLEKSIYAGSRKEPFNYRILDSIQRD